MSRLSLPLLLLCAIPAASCALRAADAWAPNLTTTAAWHRNATYADQSDDQLDSLRLKADVLAFDEYGLTRDDTLRLTARFAGDWWPRYNALLQGGVGGRAELRHRFGTDAMAPVLSVEGAIDGVEARESDRRGFGTGVTFRLGKRFDKLTRAALSHEISWYDAKRGTYDSGASETAFAIDRDLTSVMRLRFAARFRDGDILSYARGPRPDLEARATSFTATDTFDRLMTAYRIDAKTWSGWLSLVRAVDDSTALEIAYEYRRSKRGPLEFPDHVLSVAMIHQF